jgi:hypothetical protein
VRKKNPQRNPLDCAPLPQLCLFCFAVFVVLLLLLLLLTHAVDDEVKSGTALLKKNQPRNPPSPTTPCARHKAPHRKT